MYADSGRSVGERGLDSEFADHRRFRNRCRSFPASRRYPWLYRCFQSPPSYALLCKRPVFISCTFSFSGYPGFEVMNTRIISWEHKAGLNRAHNFIDLRLRGMNISSSATNQFLDI